MTPARTRRVLAASGLVTALTAVLGLWTFGGPEASRRESRDTARLAHLETITGRISCHVDAGLPPPTDLAAVSEGCLSATEAADLVDPETGAAYSLDYSSPGLLRACAGFEDAARLPSYVSPSFDRATGCLSQVISER